MYIYPLKAAHCKTGLLEQSLKAILAAKKKNPGNKLIPVKQCTVLTVFKLVSNASDGYSRHFSRLFSMAKKSNAACNAAPFKAWLVLVTSVSCAKKWLGGDFCITYEQNCAKKHCYSVISFVGF